MPQFEYEPVTTLSNDIVSLSVYYFNPYDIDETQIIAILKNKTPLDSCGFNVFLTSFYPAYRGNKTPDISYNYYKTDTLVFEPQISQYFYYDKTLDTLNVYLNIVKSSAPCDIKEGSVSYLGPMKFIRVKKSIMSKSKNKKIEILNKEFPAIKKYERYDKDLVMVEVDYPMIGWMEYGTTIQFGSVTKPKLIDDDEESGWQKFALKTSELLYDTIYFYRYIILYHWYVSFGNIRTFQTLPENVIKKYFIVSDTMYQKKQNKIVFKISKMALRELYNDYEIVREYISSEMLIEASNIKVKLSDPSGNNNFLITSLNNERQVLKDTLFTQWEWSIIPLTSEIQKLSLNISVENLKGLNDIPFPFGSLEVFVVAEPLDTKILNFIINNWQWFVTTAIALAALFFVKRKTKTKAKRSKTK